MARTTATLVQNVLMDDYGPRADGTSPDLSPYIDTASAMIDDVVACALAQDPSVAVGSTRAELLERWLAAHLYASVDQPYTSKSTGGASASFQGQTGMYLEGTKYGQTAARLDSTGCLQAVAGAERKSARLVWLGKPYSTQTDYDRRD